MKPYFYLTLLLSTLLTSCETQIIDPPVKETTKHFLQWLEGSESIYLVKEKNFTTLGEDSSVYYRKEIIKEIIDDYALVQVFTGDDTTSFELTETISLNTEDQLLIRNEGEKRYLDLIVPVVAGKSHDENAFNSMEEERLTLVEVQTMYQLNDSLLSDCIVLEKQEVDNLINKENFIKVYQSKKGLVYYMERKLSQQPGQSPIGHETTWTRLF